MKKTTKTESLKNKQSLRDWYKLMDECVSVDEERWARDYFDDVETLARELNLTLVGGKEFHADDALDEWRWCEEKVNQWIDEDDLEDDFPSVGLVYRRFDDRLVLGIHDGIGGFVEMTEWSFD